MGLGGAWLAACRLYVDRPPEPPARLHTSSSRKEAEDGRTS